uniref:G patch domain-containing protein 4-like isoform X1 n=1 Tax=Myxine glutinosa TaxID=7769 RepID=UPI00359006AB
MSTVRVQLWHVVVLVQDFKCKFRERRTGLGRNATGTVKPIKVTNKQDLHGIGHDPAAEFTNCWWQDMYNSAAHRVEVDTSESVVGFGEKSGGKVDKKPNEDLLAMQSRKDSYSRFIRSGIHNGGREVQADDPERLEILHGKREKEQVIPAQLTDEQLLKACGGRTGHRAARLGLTMSAKLARLERQELAFLQSQKLNAHGKLDNSQNNFGSAANEDIMANTVKLQQRLNKTAVMGVQTTQSAEDLVMEAASGLAACEVRKRGRCHIVERDSASDQPTAEEAAAPESSDCDRKKEKRKRIRRNKRHQDAEENELKKQNVVKDEVEVDGCKEKKHKDKRRKKQKRKERAQFQRSKLSK